MKIPITKIDLQESDQQAVLRTLQSGWLVQGPQVSAFEASFRDFTKSPLALATTSCTTALHLALIVAGVKAGDEVIVPAFTWVATANVVENLGATPVFCDVDLSTYNLDTSRLDACRTPRTRAAIPVSLFGLSADLDPILEWSRENQIQIIEDAACALGTYYRGHHAGTLCDYGAFSFHPRKTLTTGEGGMLTSRHPQSLDLLRSLRDHGASDSDLSRHIGPRPYILPSFPNAGFNYRMTDLQGALGNSQMGRLSLLLETRQRWAQAYLENFSKLSTWLKPPHTPPEMHHAYQSFVCLYAPETPSWANVDRLHEERNRLMEYLQERGISTRPGTHSVHTLDYYANKYRIRPQDYPAAFFCDRLTIALPLFGTMTPQEHSYVLDQLEAFFR